MNAIHAIIESVIGDQGEIRMLDVGCGDGFVCRDLSRRADVQVIYGVDVHLTDREVDALRKADEKVIYSNDYIGLPEKRCDLVLLLDVLEHVREDVRFLDEIADRYLSNDGYLVITVPAFQSLYSHHDTFLAHFRRYDRKALIRLIHGANLSCIRSGYLFLSLLPVRIAEVVHERMTGVEGERAHGVGRWAAGRTLTCVVKGILQFDNRFSLFLNSFGVRIPGLTVWAVCGKRA